MGTVISYIDLIDSGAKDKEEKFSLLGYSGKIRSLPLISDSTSLSQSWCEHKFLRVWESLGVGSEAMTMRRIALKLGGYVYHVGGPEFVIFV
jgi:hypothetical protein